MNKEINILSSVLNSKYFQKNYKLYEDDVLGSGGFGKVFLCRSTKKNGEYFAIKLQYFPENHYDQEHFREIQTIKELGDHPHIVKNIDYFPEPEKQKKYDYNYIVMELADQSLFSILHPKNQKKVKMMKKPILIQMIFDLISGLQYANSKNISHSDIKPGNILSLKQSRQEGCQKYWVEDEKIIFKLCDWGIARMAKIGIDKTQTLCNHEKTVSYAAPELNKTSEKIRVNLMKADIYSLGLVILNCCGADNSDFPSLNYTFDQKGHETLVKKLLLKWDVQVEYGEEMVNLIKNMLTFEQHERYGFKKILASLDKIVHELKEANRCRICKENHSQKITLSSGHVFGTKCLDNFLCDKFKDDVLNIPRCPLETCEKIIKRDVIEQILEDRESSDLKKYYGYCSRNNKCHKELMYKTFLPRLSCSHRFCEDCLIRIKRRWKCPICNKAISKEDATMIKYYTDQCRVCEEEPIYCFKFSCCNVELCEKCLFEHFLQDFYTKKNNGVFCKHCEKDLSNLDISEILSKSSFKRYSLKLCNECNKYQDEIENIPACVHKICVKCLKKRILKSEKIDRQCPDENCGKEIPNEIIVKYIIICEGNIGNLIKNNNQIQADWKKTNEENITQIQNKIEEKKCSKCEKPCKNEETLRMSDCQHNFCAACLKQNLSLRLENNLLPSELLKCLDSVCVKPMKLSELITIIIQPLHSKLEVSVNKQNNKLEEEQKQDNQRGIINPQVKEKKLCEFCKREMSETDGSFTASCCKRNCCIFCIRKDLTTKIKQELWDSLRCICCNFQLSHQFIMNTVEIDIGKKYDESLLKTAMEKINKKEENTPQPPKSPSNSEDSEPEDNLKKPRSESQDSDLEDNLKKD